MAANVNDKLEFDYTNYSHASVKLYLDSLHLIKCDPVDVAVIVECIDFVQFEGKTSLFNSFDRDFVAALMDSITDLTVGTELLISAYLSCVGTLDNGGATKNPDPSSFSSLVSLYTAIEGNGTLWETQV